MPQVTLSVPSEKMPLLKDFLYAMGIENKSVKNLVSQGYRTNERSSEKIASKSMFQKYFGWEYFLNELEYE